jgi:Icc-related predicted phosphoesterase
MKIVFASDTHSQNLITKWEWPDGDILIHAGDFTARGSIESIKKVGRELNSLPYRYKILVPGNHDRLEGDPGAWRYLQGSILLRDESININGWWIHGMSWNRYKPNMFPTQIFSLQELTDMIPSYTNLLITHIPPYMIMDRSHDDVHLGSTSLLARAGLVKPSYHVFGHAHRDYGVKVWGDTTFINASLVNNHENKPTNKPILIEI